jgi:hypothetical protein
MDALLRSPLKTIARAAQKFSSGQSQRGVAPIRIIKNWQILHQTPAAELPQLGLKCAENRSFSFRNRRRHLWKVRS